MQLMCARGISLLKKAHEIFSEKKEFFRILVDFLSETFLPKVYEIFWSEMPLGCLGAHLKIFTCTKICSQKFSVRS